MRFSTGSFAEREGVSDEFDEIVASVKKMCAELLTAPKYTIMTLPSHMPAAGIYLFSESGCSLYVGRTNKLRQRLRYHIGNSHNQATLAFLLARQQTGRVKASYQPKGSRKDLLLDPTFRAAFDGARSRIRRMHVQFVEEPDPVRQTILEVLAALETKALHNDFDNH